MSSRKAAFADGWERACHLYSELSSGGTVPFAAPTTVRLLPGEQTLADAHFGFERHMGRNVRAPVEAQRKDGLFRYGILPGAIIRATHNRKVRSRNKAWSEWAEREATPRWQHFGIARTVLTDRRILCDHNGWVIFNLDGVVELRPAPQTWYFELYFGDTAPLRLVGAMAPWCSIALASLLYGPNGLRLPGLEIFPGSAGQPFPACPPVPK
ncbi:MAG TPA: hypothetical protein VHC49_19145 [Mycobacteriales bacterium]|nr:hypothetical protein [Mycobacteriales bacterium]